MIFYFSGTGNSAWVARQIAKAQQEELLAIAEEINKNKEYVLKDGEKVGFVFPVYAWGPPGIVLRFIRQLKMKNPEYLFFVCTCGDDTGRTAQVFHLLFGEKDGTAWQATLLRCPILMFPYRDLMLMPRMWKNRKYRMQWHVLTLSMANWPVGYT